MLWSDKYRPARASDLIGNPSIITKLKDWLSRWYDGMAHLDNQYCVGLMCVTRRWLGWYRDANFLGASKAKTKTGDHKAALLSGPPGIGKTSTAFAVCRDFGYEIIEFNASDTRSKGALQVRHQPDTQTPDTKRDSE
jgi:replication factor C subunit 1